VKSTNQIIAWFSCGVTSAVACKLALQIYDNVELYYIDIGSQCRDSIRFLEECQDWYGQKITILTSKEYCCHFDVIEKERVIGLHNYFPCTKKLKKDVRYALQDDMKEWGGQVWGFELGEEIRATRMLEQYPDLKSLFPLIEAQLTKENCAFILEQQGIELPKMYKLGYNNNNCIGCVRGGMGYWNKIRVDFPNIFQRMAKLERKIGHSCLTERVNRKKIPLFLDELDPNRGSFPTEIIPECGLFCELEFINQ